MWGNPTTLARHFSDHGADFAATTMREYAQQAGEFHQHSQGGNKVSGTNGIKLSANSLLINELRNQQRNGMGPAETASIRNGAGSDMGHSRS